MIDLWLFLLIFSFQIFLQTPTYIPASTTLGRKSPASSLPRVGNCAFMMRQKVKGITTLYVVIPLT